MSLWKLLRTDRIPPGVQQQLAILPWYDPSQINDATPRMEIGQFWYDEGTGNIYAYVKAAAALGIGQVVALQAPGTDTVAGGSTTSVVNLVTGGLTVNAEKGNYVNFSGIDGATTIGTRQIKGNTASSITVSLTSSLTGINQPDLDVLPSIPAGASAVQIIRPWNVVVCTASLVPFGVALGTVTSGNFTIVQVGGLAQVLGNNTVGAIVAGAPVQPIAAGVVSGTPAQAGAAPVVNLFTAGVNITPQVAYAAAPSILLPMMLNCLGA